MRKMTITLLSVSTLTFMILCVHQQRQIRELRSQESAAIEDASLRLRAQNAQHPLSEDQQANYKKTIEQLSERLDQQIQRTDIERKVHDTKVKQLRSVIEAMKADSTMTDRDTADADPSPEKDRLDPPAKKMSLRDNLAKAMNNPGMKKMMREQQKVMMDMTYGSLYELLDLPAEDMEILKDLLLEKQVKLMDVGFEMMDSSFTDDNMQEKGQQIEEATKEIDRQIEALLGDENQEVYEAYQTTQPERMQVKLFNQALEGDDRLDSQQENDLIWALHEAQVNSTIASAAEDPEILNSTEFDLETAERELEESTRRLEQYKQESMNPLQFDPEMMERQLEESAMLHEQYIEIAAEMLTPSQLDQFKSSLEQQRAMQEMGMKMLSGMFEDQEADESLAVSE